MSPSTAQILTSVSPVTVGIAPPPQSDVPVHSTDIDIRLSRHCRHCTAARRVPECEPGGPQSSSRGWAGCRRGTFC